MAKRLGPRSPRSPMATVTAVAPENTAASKMFDQFCTANTFQVSYIKTNDDEKEVHAVIYKR